MLFSHWALIPQLCLHFFQKLKYYTLENKDYSWKLFWVVAAISVNAGEVKGTVSPLVKTRNKLSWVLWTSLQKPNQLQDFYWCLDMVNSWLLKLLSAFVYQMFIFHQMITLQKLWKMFFISPKKLFFVLKIFNFSYFCLPVFFSLSAIALEVDPRKVLKFMMSSTA